ncbi:MAG: aldo/keto reductase [Bacillota bacterium]|nr:aldo/keto reductase [Bacillota bacterium]
MKYRLDRYGNPVSILGFGCMRFPLRRGKIDMKETEQEILTAYRSGINYYDTAYIYPGSEAALGKILQKNAIREQVYIATKLPHYLLRRPEDIERIFREELQRLRSTYIDYYLLHMLSDLESWERLKSLGFENWLAEKKKSGAIRQIGFSYHGNSEMFCRLLDAFDWDFCQIQYNYMDEHSQAGRRGLHHAHEKGLPVIIMEPLRGGKLVSRLPEEAKQLFATNSRGWSAAEWALRWLWNQPEVCCVLSGMNSDAMLRENVNSASRAEAGDLGLEDQHFLQKVASAINARMKVACTGCSYCLPCPAQVDIPGSFSAYNRRYSEGRFWAKVDYFVCTALRKNATSASNCIGCGKCEKHCPQGIAIREELKNVCKEMETPVYRFFRSVLRLLKIF